VSKDGRLAACLAGTPHWARSRVAPKERGRVAPLWARSRSTSSGAKEARCGSGILAALRLFLSGVVAPPVAPVRLSSYVASLRSCPFLRRCGPVFSCAVAAFVLRRCGLRPVSLRRSFCAVAAFPSLLRTSYFVFRTSPLPLSPHPPCRKLSTLRCCRTLFPVFSCACPAEAHPQARRRACLAEAPPWARRRVVAACRAVAASLRGTFAVRHTKWADPPALGSGWRAAAGRLPPSLQCGVSYGGRCALRA